jgi:hypothetical protein
VALPLGGTVAGPRERVRALSPEFRRGHAVSPQKHNSPLLLEGKIPLGSVAGRIDHMAIDLARRRLFVAELGNNIIRQLPRRYEARQPGPKCPTHLVSLH